LGSLAALLIALGVGTAYQAKTVDDLRDGCERGNPQRQLLATNTKIDVASRRAALPGISDLEARKSLRNLADLGADKLAAFVAAQSEVAVAPGSVVADCKAAYPKPWPWSLGD
jgi:hypothetical protein